MNWDRIVMMREPNSDYYYWRQIISITRLGALVIPGSHCLIYLMLKIGASILLVNCDYGYIWVLVLVVVGWTVIVPCRGEAA